MVEKIEKSMDRMELAAYLENLAAQLRSGHVQVAGRRWRLPESMEAKLELKEKKGRLVSKLKWHWSTLADYEPADRQRVEDWKARMQRAKKRMSTSFKHLRQGIEHGRMPEPQVVAEFVADCAAFAELAEPEWQEAMQTYNDHLANLQRAARDGQLDVVQHELRDLLTSMRACHHAFK